MTSRRLSPDELGALFPTVRRSSWRWECQGHYAVDEPELAEWRAGREVAESGDDRAWVAYVEGLAAAGIPFERVRVVPEPPTEYSRWIHGTTERNIAAGEDIRWLAEPKARTLRMPAYDFYLFDDERLVILRFDDAKVMTGIECEDAPEVVAEHREYRRRAWSAAVPHHLYDPAAW